MTVGNMSPGRLCEEQSEIDSEPVPICLQTFQDGPRVKIDPDGDLCLNVGESRCIDPDERDHDHEIARSFVVCSKTISRASTVFKKMLYGNFAESRRTRGMEWTVDLPEDNAEAMETLLNIIHARFESLPRLGEMIGLEELYELTVLTDKYDLTHILRPWAKSWVSAEGIQWPDTSDVLQMERQVWTAWELGDKALFEKGARALVLHSSAREPFSGILEPPGMSDMVSDIRLETIERLIKPFQTAISLLMKKDKEMADGRKSLCYHYHNRDRCESIMLGSLIRSFSSNNLWPLPSPEDFDMSVKELVNMINSFTCLHLDNYHKCLPVSGATEKMDDTLRSLRVSATDYQVVHLDRQAKSSGLES